MGERLVGDDLPAIANCRDGAFQIDRIPEHDSCDDQIQSGCPVSLVFVRAVPKLPEAVEEDRPGERVARPLSRSGLAR